LEKGEEGENYLLLDLCGEEVDLPVLLLTL
jgi:hypothetical protein